MRQQSEQAGFSFAPFIMLFLPYAAIAYFCEKNQLLPSGVIAVGGITALSVVLFVTRNWAELVAGMLATLLIIAVLSICALIPFVGWIASVLLILYALTSILATICTLTPFALKAAAIWAAFLVSLLPDLFHPIVSPAFVLLLSLGLGAAAGKKESPLDEFILLMSSIPLLILAVISLGRLFQSGIVMRNTQVQQNVSGYTTRAGVQVGDYTRTITKVVPVGINTLNPGAAAVGSAAGQMTKDDSGPDSGIEGARPAAGETGP